MMEKVADVSYKIGNQGEVLQSNPTNYEKLKETLDKLKLSILMVIFAVIVLFVFTLPTFKAQLGYEIVDLQKEVISLTAENELLSLDISKLKSPTRIQEIAQKDLGMILPSEFVYSSSKASVVREDTLVAAKLQNQ